MNRVLIVATALSTAALVSSCASRKPASEAQTETSIPAAQAVTTADPEAAQRLIGASIEAMRLREDVVAARKGRTLNAGETKEAAVIADLADEALAVARGQHLAGDQVAFERSLSIARAFLQELRQLFASAESDRKMEAAERRANKR